MKPLHHREQGDGQTVILNRSLLIEQFGLVDPR